MKKKCLHCGLEKNLDDFLSHKGHKDGKRSECRECTSIKGKKRYREKLKDCPIHREWNRKRNAEWYYSEKEEILSKRKIARKKERELVIKHYGGRCECCGQSQFEFLAIDHIEGGGGKHRKKVGNIAPWLIRNNYPDGFRILCHNCNQSLGVYGYCPHTK